MATPSRTQQQHLCSTVLIAAVTKQAQAVDPFLAEPYPLSAAAAIKSAPFIKQLLHLCATAIRAVVTS